MRSKKKKRKAAYRNGEKLVIFFRRGIFFLLIVIFIALAVLGVKFLKQSIIVREILIYGNYHLDNEDIINAAKVRKGSQLLELNFEDIEERLKQNAWIKKVALKKRFPGTLLINIKEAVPKALLGIRKRLYLIDENGETLEKIKGESTPFLPVIKDINPKNRKGISEALKLIDAMAKKDIFADSESIEIGLESYGLTMNIDGEFIKVGYGKYSEKLKRWLELEPEIRKRGLPIKYVDLRFKDSVIVKPVKSSREEPS